MHVTSLRKVGGSVMFAVPPVLLDLLSIGAGTKVGVSVDHGRLVVDPTPVEYTLADMIAQCDLNAPLPEVDALWLNSAPIGEELI
ncbi:AbrB/MazE/SpoVT family DNA-binding domain-containing protein [Brucella sp. C7-11G]